MDAKNEFGTPVLLSPGEQRQVRLVQLCVYAAPVAIGALTFPILVSAERLLGRNHYLSETLIVIAFWLNVLVAGACAAHAVARLHPIRAGAWWRAAAAFGFGSATAVATFLVTSWMARSLGYHL